MDGDFPATEQSPLANPDASLSSSSSSLPSLSRSPSKKVVQGRRRRSSMEILMRELLTHFEYERASSFDEDEQQEEGSSSSYGDSNVVVNEERRRIRGSRERTSFRLYMVSLVCAVLSVMVMFFLIGWFSRSLTFPTTRVSSSNTIWTTETTTITNEEDILTLKKDSAIENLQYGAVASDHKVCSKVGVDILMTKGGNAIDAAVATTLCLGVANPASSGIGGGAFILIHSSKSHHETRYDPSESPKFEDQREKDVPDDDTTMITEVIDCRETAPAAATQDMYTTTDETSSFASAFGGLAVAVPGELKGLELAHARHGSLPWSDVVAPAIELARNGVPVSMHLAGDIHGMKTVSAKYGDYPALRRFLTKYDDWDSGYKEGELLRNPQLAQTLALIAVQGSKAFYEGDLAEIIARDVQAEGGILTVDDMRKYLPVLRSPVRGVANGYTIVGVPPPSSGGAALIGAIRFLSGYSLPMASCAEDLAVHRTAEAMRHVFAIRMSLSDPTFFVDKNAQAVFDLTSGLYMESLRKITMDSTTLRLSQYGGTKWAQLHDHDGEKDIDDAHEGDRRRRLRRSNSSHRILARRFGYLEDNGTTHLSVVDKDGNAVAITSSVNNIFGSNVFSESTGVLLGNTMDDFGNPGRSNVYGLTPSEANFISPGKRVSVERQSVLCLFTYFLSNGYHSLAATLFDVTDHGVSKS